MNNGNILVESAYLGYREGLHTQDVQSKTFIADQLDNELLTLSFFQDGCSMHIAAKLKQPLVVELFSVTFNVKKEGAVLCLNRQYNLFELKEEIWNNDLTPLYINYKSNNKHYLLSNATGLFSYSVKDEGDHLYFTIYADAAALHPAWSHRTPERISDGNNLLSKGYTYNLSFGIHETDPQAMPPVLCRYPNGTEAGFIITDHCDYDQVGTLYTFLHGNESGKGGWLGKGLKLTKGVFALTSERKKDNAAASLQDEAYRKLIDKLHHDSSEIAPHALNQSGQLNKEAFEDALSFISKQYECRTWIDHGSYQKYTYSVGGGDNEYRLIDRLKEYDYSSLWSYHDAPVDASQSLNIFSTTAISFKQVGRNILRGNLSVAGHYLKSILERKAQTGSDRWAIVKVMGAIRKNMIGKKSISGLIKDMRNAFKNSSHQQFPYTAKELNNFSPLLYTESKQPLYQQTGNELLLFATQEVVHTQDCYNETLLKKLIADKGLHIGHTYLLNTLPYVNGLFDKHTGQLCKLWISFVDALSIAVKEGMIWNPTIHDFITYTKQLSSVHVYYDSTRSMMIENKTGAAISGISFITKASYKDDIRWNGVIPSSRQTGKNDELIFWGDIPAFSSVRVNW